MNSIDTSIFERFPKLMAGGMPFQEARRTPALDMVFIEGFEGETVIGIDPQELHATQPVKIDLWAGVPRSLACDTDHIVDTIDYGKVVCALRALLADHGVQLLEALAETIAQMLLVDFGAQWVRVAVVKPRKFEDVVNVGVCIERGRR
jgi:dihydroneopterin aldolase